MTASTQDEDEEDNIEDEGVLLCDPYEADNEYEDEYYEEDEEYDGEYYNEEDEWGADEDETRKPSVRKGWTLYWTGWTSEDDIAETRNDYEAMVRSTTVSKRVKICSHVRWNTLK